MGMDESESTWTKPKANYKFKKNSRPRVTGSQVSSSQPVKRLVPFLSSTDEDDLVARPPKRPKLEESLDRRISQAGPNQVLNICEDSQDSSPTNLGDTSGSRTGARAPPLDWSLKSRARLSSPSTFGWTQHLSTVEEASAITGGVRCLSLSRGRHCLNTSLRAQFHAAGLYWQHPSLPVPLFPRYSHSSMRSSPSSVGPSLSLSPDMQRALHSDWMSSLQSVYQLVKARQCPYFYLLGPSFTCLFRAAGVGGTQELSALLTPSTSGLRTALKREDVEFTLPLYKPKQEEAEEGGVPESDSTTEFLESLGIEADSLPGLSNPAPKNRLAAGQGSANNIDGRTESLVLVEGVECQSLLNYLLNAKLTLGQGAGALPPTLLAPVAFHGASLRSVKVRQSVIPGRGHTPGHHHIELTGPILPSAVQTMVRLAATNNTHYTVTLHTVEDTVSFCKVQPKGGLAPSAFASASLGDCGLSSELLETFTSPTSDTDRETGDPVRDLVWKDGQFSVNSLVSAPPV